jgi:UDP-N-acetylmuramate dehydrogenase
VNFENQLLNQSTQARPLFIEENVSLADKNWFKTGGNARYYCKPQTNEHMQEALAWARAQEIAVFLLGEGANVLISDEGCDGLVISPALTSIEIVAQDETHAWVKAGAGVPFPALIDFCLSQNLGGLHEFSGIPGTVGGSIFINIHYFEFLLDSFLTSSTVIDKKTCELLSVENGWFDFGYNYSTLHKQEHIVLDATFKLKKLTPLESAYAQGRRDEMIRQRSRRYPPARTCGSFFRNFYEDEVTFESNGKKIIYVAYYFDKLGFKGQLSIGNAFVFHLHANMIVTKEHATSHDVIALARIMQERVYQEFGMLPQPECRLMGFKEYPLLTL